MSKIVPFWKLKEPIWITREFKNCSGCRMCEIECSLHHEGRIWPEASRVRVFMMVPGVDFPHLCTQYNFTEKEAFEVYNREKSEKLE